MISLELNVVVIRSVNLFKKLRETKNEPPLAYRCT
jgi:hypothetical protein